MTTHILPDGALVSHPDGLDVPVREQLASVMDRAIEQAGIAATPEGEALTELLSWRKVDRVSDGPMSDDGFMALQRLRDVADRLGAA